MTEEWVIDTLLRLLSNLPQHMHEPAGVLLQRAAGTSDIWVPWALATWVGILLACAYVVNGMGGKDRFQ